MTAPTVGALAVAVGKVLAARVWLGTTERAIQESIAEVLSGDLGATGPAYRVVREHSLSAGDRVDFALVLEDARPNVLALEIKLEAPVGEVARQVQRYTLHGEVGAVILATTSRRLAAAMPRRFGTVPLYSLILRRM